MLSSGQDPNRFPTCKKEMSKKSFAPNAKKGLLNKRNDQQVKDNANVIQNRTQLPSQAVNSTWQHILGFGFKKDTGVKGL